MACALGSQVSSMWKNPSPNAYFPYSPTVLSLPIRSVLEIYTVTVN